MNQALCVEARAMSPSLKILTSRGLCLKGSVTENRPRNALRKTSHHSTIPTSPLPSLPNPVFPSLSGARVLLVRLRVPLCLLATNHSCLLQTYKWIRT